MTAFSGARWQDYREIKDTLNTLDSLGSDLRENASLCLDLWCEVKKGRN